MNIEDVVKRSRQPTKKRKDYDDFELSDDSESGEPDNKKKKADPKTEQPQSGPTPMLKTAREEKPDEQDKPEEPEKKKTKPVKKHKSGMSMEKPRKRPAKSPANKKTSRVKSSALSGQSPARASRLKPPPADKKSAVRVAATKGPTKPRTPARTPTRKPGVSRLTAGEPPAERRPEDGPDEEDKHAKKASSK